MLAFEAGVIPYSSLGKNPGILISGVDMMIPMTKFKFKNSIKHQRTIETPQ